jgi:uncharacterized repeat protein (TIGR03806 family)
MVKFIPLSTFNSIPTLIKYTVKDKQGNVSNQAKILVVESLNVSVNLENVPYPKLSDYKFFSGELKNQTPSTNVLPYEPASSLFTDYAHKKRFVWMPVGQKATYNGDTKVLELPIGAALIKTFYYDKMQPSNTTRIIETRVMIRKSSGWIFADYIWNAAQTEATFSLAGSFTNITFKDDNDVVKTTNYRIPNDIQCIVCHKSNQTVAGNLVVSYVPIGIKPQNLNFNYNYNGESKNQLTKWIEQGYLQNNFTYPTNENSSVNYNDTSKPLGVRARSYIDANCSHCHQSNRHCDYRPMRFAFSETSPSNPLSETNFGLCVNTSDMQSFPPTLDKVIRGGNPLESMLYYRINTTDEGYRMPLHGRTLIHDEGVILIRDWINSLSSCH